MSRFENARNAVIICTAELRDGNVNRVLLAEEIQHGLDRATNEASRAIRRGLTNGSSTLSYSSGSSTATLPASFRS